MFSRIYKKLQTWERNYYASFGDDISTPEGRRQAVRHSHIVDHAFLRRFWTNMYPLGGQAWRSNQPDRRRFDHFKELGLRSIINLRGEHLFSYYLFEREACADYDIKLINYTIYARELATREEYLGLLDLFKTVERPFLMHCKSGADRAGLASALFMLDQMNAPVEEAMKQLSFKYIHLKNVGTGILDHMLEHYAADIAQNPMPIREWLETRYDRDAITASFNLKRGKKS